LERAQIQSWLGYLNAEVHAARFRAINRPQRYCPDETV
jgi:glutathione S-transferase